MITRSKSLHLFIYRRNIHLFIYVCPNLFPCGQYTLINSKVTFMCAQGTFSSRITFAYLLTFNKQYLPLIFIGYKNILIFVEIKFVVRKRQKI